MSHDQKPIHFVGDAVHASRHGRWGDRLALQARGLNYPGHQHPEIELNWLPPENRTSATVMAWWSSIRDGPWPGSDVLGRIAAWLSVRFSI